MPREKSRAKQLTLAVAAELENTRRNDQWNCLEDALPAASLELPVRCHSNLSSASHSADISNTDINKTVRTLLSEMLTCYPLTSKANQFI